MAGPRVARIISPAHLGGLQGDLDVAALDGQVEACALVAHKVQRHLREALLLQVRDDGLPREPRAPDHGQHRVELPLQQRQLEHVLRRVHLQNKEATRTLLIRRQMPFWKKMLAILLLTRRTS